MNKLLLLILFFLINLETYAQCNVTITGNNTICAGQATTLTAVVTGNTGTVNYAWAANPGSNPNPSNTQSITVSPSGNTTYTVNVNGGGCINSSENILVTVRPLPNVPNFTISPSTIQCSGTPISFSVSNPQGGVTYSWNFGDGTNGTGASTTHSYNSIGNGNATFNVTVTATLNGCTRTSNVLAVQVRQRPDASLFDPDNTIEFTSCGGGNFNLNVSNNSTTTSTNTNYVINWGDGTPNYSSSTFTTVNHTYNSQGNFTITLTVTGQNGCVSSRTYSVYNGSNPAVGLGNPGGTTGLCAPGVLTFPITGTQNNTPGTTYTITVNDGSNSVIYNHPPPQSHTHTFNLTSCGRTSPSYQNSFFVSIKAENPCASSTATIEPITINSLPDADFSIPATACVNTPVSITNISDPGAWVNPQNQCDTTGIFNWIITPSAGWTLTQGTLGQDPPQPNNQNSWGSNVIRPSFIVPGTYTVKLKIRNRSNCGTDSIQKQICIQPQPTANFTFNQNPLCVPSTIQITNQSNSLNTCGNTTYSWAVAFSNSLCATNGTYAFINGTNPNSINPVIRLDSAGVYTVTQTVTNICGTVSSSQTITVKGRPKVTIDNIPNICANSRTINPTATVRNCYANNLSYSWSFTGGTPTSSGAANPTNISFPNPGTYTISLTVTNECGTASATTTFSNTPLPIANAGSDTAICVGNSVRIGGNPTASGGNGTYTYSWSPTANLSSSNIANPIANPTATTTYTVTVTSNNCTATDQVTVTVNPRPTVSITPNNPAICIGNSTTLTASGGTDYVWSTGATTASITINPTSNTNYSVTVTNVNGCTNTATSTVTVNPLPNIVINPNNPAICIGNSATLTASGGTNYVWSTGATTASITVNPTINTTYSVTGTNANGCSNTANTSVTVNALPNVSATANQNIICAGQTATLTATGASSYTWSPSNGLNTTTGAIVTASPTVTTTYIVTGTSGLNCQDTGRVTITVNPQPTVTISPNNPSVCLGASTTLTASGGLSYVWSTGATIAAITVTPTTTTTYTVTVSSTNGCTNTGTSTVTVNPLPNITISPNNPAICIGGSSTLTASGGTTYVWSTNSTTASITVSPTVNSTFSVTGTNANGCSNTANTSVTVNALPNVSATANQNIICAGQSTTLTATGANSYTWSPATGLNTTTGATVTASPTVTTTYIVTGTSGLNCQDTGRVTITVNPQPTVSITPNNPAVCIGNSTTLTASGGTNYVWSTGATTASITVNPTSTTNYTVTVTNANGCTNTGTSSVTVNPLPIVNAGTDQQFCNQNIPVQLTGTPSGGTWSGTGVTSGGSFNPSTAGNGSWELIYNYTDQNNCNNIDTMIATVINPTLANAGTGFARCVNAVSVNLNTLNPTPTGGTWSGVGVSNNSFSPATAGVGSFILTYSIGSGTCLSSDTIQVVVNPLPTITISPNSSICIGDSIQLNSSGGITYNWSSNTGLSSSTNSNPIAKPTVTTTYTVSVTDNNGCADSRSTTITVNPLPVVNAGPVITVCNQPIAETLTGFSPTTGGQGVWSGVTNITPAGVFTPTGIGTFTVTYTFTDGNGCISNDSRDIIVVDPVLPNAGTGFAQCVNSASVNLNSLNPTPSGGTWSGTGVSNNSFSPATAGAGNYVLIYSIGTGTCLASDTIQVVVNPLPTITISQNSSICIGDSIQLNSSGGITYSWSPSTGLSSSTISNPIAKPTVTTIYTVSVTDNNGCADSRSTTITVNPLPIVNAGPDITVCNQPIAETLTGFSPTTGGQGVWLGNGVTSSGVFTPSITGLGQWTLIYRFTDNNGCTNTDSIIVTVIEPILAVAGPSDTFCLNNPAIILTGYSPAGGVFSGQGIVDSQTGLFNPTLAGSGIRTITYSYGTGTCLTSASTNYLVRPLPTVNFTNNVTCIGDSTQFSDLSNAIEGNIISWTWSFGDGDSSNIQNPTHTYNSNGDYFVNLFVENTVGCFNDTTIRVTVHPLPTVTFTHPPLGCPDSSITFVLTTIDAIQYNWDFGDGNTGTGANPTHIYTNSGTYTIRLNAVTQFGCIDSLSSTITIAERPSAYFIATPDSGCGPVKVIIRYLPQNSANGFDYTWTLGNGDTIYTMIPPDTITYQPPTFNGDTTYYISAWVQSRLCQQVDVHRDSVKVFSVPRISFIPDNSEGCSPLQVNFSNQTKGLIDSILIDFGNGIDTIIYGRVDLNQTFENFSNTDTSFTVKIKAFNKCGVTEDSLVVTVFPNTVNASISITPSSNCANEIFTLYNNSSGARYIYYDLGSGSPNIYSDTSQILNFSISESGEYWIYQYIYSGDSCSFDVDSFKVTVYENPKSDFEAEQKKFECSGPVEVTFSNLTVGAVKYEWNFSNGNTSIEFNPIYIYDSAGVYYVTLTSENIYGCKDDTTKPVSINYRDNGLRVPNAFSPEYGEPLVRIFKPSGICIGKYKLRIFNTWGELVFETDKLDDGQPSEGWDGRHMVTGDLLPHDVYIWKIEATFLDNEEWQGKKYDSDVVKRIGTVTLIR